MHRDLQWYIGTRDAHELYRRFGFRELDDGRTMVRPRADPPSGSGGDPSAGSPLGIEG
jgi:hypothetical protein